jgi:hypothetical protein
MARRSASALALASASASASSSIMTGSHSRGGGASVASTFASMRSIREALGFMGGWLSQRTSEKRLQSLYTTASKMSDTEGKSCEGTLLSLRRYSPSSEL